MSLNTASGSKLYIGTTAAIDFTTNETALAGFEADVWTEVGEIENMGEIGDESAAVTFASLSDGRVRKLKGARDAGTPAFVVGRDPLNLGQIAVKAAERTKFNYNFKVVHADAQSQLYSNSIEYFRGLVMSARNNIGENDNVVRTTYNVGINSDIIEDLSALISP